MRELKLVLDSCVGMVLEGKRRVELERYGRKVETGRAVASAAGRGVFMRVVRDWVVRGCRRPGLCFQVRLSKCLRSGAWQTFDKNGVRKVHDASCWDAIF